MAVSIAQTTELGTLYSVAEVRAIADYVHARGMVLHMDGSRISNAAAALGVPLAEFTVDAGVDILSFGGTKNGLLYGEAIVVLDASKSDGLIFLRKLNMQLASKMRFVSAQLLALLADDLYLRSAAHANAMAARLRSSLETGIEDGTITGLAFSQPTQANAVFAVLGNAAADRIRERVRFYDWDRAGGEVRWMTAFDTTEADIDNFVAVITEELAR
jgi:threonine aldolase